jgi:hypothetical protein
MQQLRDLFRRAFWRVLSLRVALPVRSSEAIDLDEVRARSW